MNELLKHIQKNIKYAEEDPRNRRGIPSYEKIVIVEWSDIDWEGTKSRVPVNKFRAIQEYEARFNELLNTCIEVHIRLQGVWNKTLVVLISGGDKLNLENIQRMPHNFADVTYGGPFLDENDALDWDMTKRFIIE